MKAVLTTLCPLAALCVGAFLLHVDSAPTGPDRAPGIIPEPPPPTARKDADSIAGPLRLSAGPAAVERLTAKLTTPSIYERVQAIHRLGELGAEARAALPHLLEIIERQPGPVAYAAMVAVMRIEGSRRYYEAMATSVAAGQDRRRALEALLRFDGTHANAIVLAFRIRNHRWGGRTAPRGLETFLRQFLEDEERGIVELNARLAGAAPDEFVTWAAIVGRMHPMPAGIASALALTLMRGEPESRLATIRLLTRPENDASALRESLEPTLRDLAAGAEPEWRGQLLGALGNLRASGPEAMNQLIAALAEGGAAADGAAVSLARLGRDARSAAPALLAAAELRAPGHRSRLVQAILAIRDASTIPFLGDALRDGDATERGIILKKVHRIEGAAALAPEFLRLFLALAGEDAMNIFKVAVRCDPDLERPATVELLMLGYADTKTGSRRIALYTTAYLYVLPGPVAMSLAAALRHAREEPLVSGATEAIKAAGRFGDAATPVVPVLLDLVTDARFEAAAVGALAKLRPDDPDCLAQFRRIAVKGRSRPARNLAILALGARKKPERSDVEALLAVRAKGARGDGIAFRRAKEILGRPAWAALVPAR